MGVLGGGGEGADSGAAAAVADRRSPPPSVQASFLGPRQVDENMHTAHQRDAARTGRFYFRDNLFPAGPFTGAPRERRAEACRA